MGILIEQLHTIKRKFVTEYYGQIPLGTYEMARNCIIKLNAIWFEVHSMTVEPYFSQFGLPLCDRDKAGFYSQKYKKTSYQHLSKLHADVQNLKLDLMVLINHYLN